MSRITKVFRHIPEEEIRTRVKETMSWRTDQKLLVILTAPVDPRPAKQIPGVKLVGFDDPLIHYAIFLVQ